jgi:hypothetical protein
MWFRESCFFVRADVKSAVAALAREVKGRVVEVKIIAALGAFDNRRQCYGDAEKDQPDQKHETGSLVRLRLLKGRHGCREVYQYQTPQVQTSSADCSKSRSIQRCVHDHFLIHSRLLATKQRETASRRIIERHSCLHRLQIKINSNVGSQGDQPAMGPCENGAVDAPCAR